MPLFQLSDQIAFPPPQLARDDGLLALGGDLSMERLLLAYSMGIFPWYSPGDPILWWSPDPRLVLYPDDLVVNRSLKKNMKRGRYRVTMDQAFEEVIHACATASRPDGEGTWLVPEMMEAYAGLHALGVAHSVEAWEDGELVGGLYGVSLGKAFFGVHVCQGFRCVKGLLCHSCDLAQRGRISFHRLPGDHRSPASLRGPGDSSKSVPERACRSTERGPASRGLVVRLL